MAHRTRRRPRTAGNLAILEKVTSQADSRDPDSDRIVAGWPTVPKVAPYKKTERGQSKAAGLRHHRLAIPLATVLQPPNQNPSRARRLSCHRLLSSNLTIRSSAVKFAADDERAVGLDRRSDATFAGHYTRFTHTEWLSALCWRRCTFWRLPDFRFLLARQSRARLRFHAKGTGAAATRPTNVGTAAVASHPNIALPGRLPTVSRRRNPSFAARRSPRHGQSHEPVVLTMKPHTMPTRAISNQITDRRYEGRNAWEPRPFG